MAGGDDRVTSIRELYAEGIRAFDAGHSDEALGLLSRALQVARAQELDSWMRVVLGELGHLQEIKGDLPAARRCWMTRVACARWSGDRLEEGLTLMALGDLELRAGETEQAEGDWTMALAIFEELNEESDADKARDLLKQLRAAHELARRTGSTVTEAHRGTWVA